MKHHLPVVDLILRALQRPSTLILAALLFMLHGTGECQPQIGSKPFVTILCRFSDDSSTPHPKSYYEGLMGDTYPSMNHYWREVSYGQMDITGSIVVGWYDLPNPRSHYIDANNKPLLDVIKQEASAVADPDVDFSKFFGYNVVLNGTLPDNCYAWITTQTLDGITKLWPATIMQGKCDNNASFAHEMGHCFGFPHSSGPYSQTYDSHWDVMSGGGNSIVQPYGGTGLHTISYHKDKVGWIPGARKYTAAKGSISTISLERLALPVVDSNYLMAKIPLTSTRFYTVESRMRAGYDGDGLPGEAVIIHLVDTTRADRVAQVVDADNNGDPNDAGAMWTPGKTFNDAANDVTVRVESKYATGFVVTIKYGNVPPTATEISPADASSQSSLPTFQVSGTDPEGAQLKFRVSVLKGGNAVHDYDQTTNAAVWDKPSYANGEIATLRIPASDILPAGNYTWVAYANDGGQWGPATTARTFTVPNVLPATPTLTSPLDGSSVSGAIKFQLKSSDQNGDPLKFRILILQGNQALYNFDQTQDPTGWDKTSYKSDETATYTVPSSTAIAPGTYRWEALVNDGTGWSQASATLGFTVTTTNQNQPPTSPSLLLPASGAAVTAMPTFKVRATDPDSGQTLKYRILITSGAQTIADFDQTKDTTGWDKGSYTSGESATLSVPVSKGLAPGQYTWQAYANDGSLWGPASSSRPMEVKAPPPAPSLDIPSDNAFAGSEPRLRLVVAAPSTTRVKMKVVITQGGQVIQTFDQTLDSTVWDKPDYGSGEKAVIVVPSTKSLPSGAYQWQAYSFDGLQWSVATGMRSFVVSDSVPKAVSGLLTVGLGLSPDDGSVSAIGLGGALLASWDPAKQDYVLSASTLNSTSGYWVKVSQATKLRLSGKERTQPTSVALQPGWNLVSSQSLAPLDWTNAGITVRLGADTKTLDQARAAGWIEDAVWNWQQDSSNQATGKYVLVADPSVVPGNPGVIAPWSGFWVYAHKQCNLLLPAPTRSVHSRSNQHNGSGWSLYLQATAASQTSSVVIGLGGSRSLQVGPPPTPPGDAGAIRFVIRRDAVALGADVSAGSSEAYSWDAEVYVPAVATSTGQHLINLTWPEVTRLHRGVELSLTDAQNGQRRVMRTSSGYSFWVSASGGTFRFRIAQANARGALQISSVQAQQARAAGAVHMISFIVNQPAQFRVRILSNGTPIRTLANRATGASGIQQVVWDGRDGRGISVASGAYIIEVQATGDEGQHAKAIIPLLLVR